MGLSSPEYKNIKLIPFPDGSLHNHPQGSDELSDPESLKSRLDSFLDPNKKKKEKAEVVSIKEYKDLSNIPKPTNLEVESEDVEEPLKSAVEIAMEKTQKYVEPKLDVVEKSYFEVPEGLSDYISELVKEGKPLKYLQWDFKDSIKSPDGWKKTLLNYCDRGVISEEEYNKAVKFLDLTNKTDVPTVNEIAMRATDKYVEKKEVAEAPVEHTQESVVEEVTTPDSSIENVEQKLDEARNNFAEQVSNWNKKLGENKRTFKKLISSLDINREVPEQAEPVDLVEAREAYIEAKKEKYKPYLEKGVIEMRQVEGQVLPLREIKYETNAELSKEIEREENKLKDAFEYHRTELQKELVVLGLEKFSKVSRIARLMISDMLASGTTLVFGERAGEVARAYSGYRMERAISGLVQKVDGIQKKNIEKIHADAMDELKTNVDEENLLAREQRFKDVLEKEENLNKKRRLISAGISAITGTKKVEDAQVFEASPESSKNTAFVFKGKEIAHEKEGILVLDDQFQDGSEFKEARVAFANAFDEKYKEGLLGITPIAIPFEEGRIYLIQEGGAVKVFLNGKEIAEGKDKKSVKLLKGIEKGWFLNNVYQRALERAEREIKTF